MDDDYMEALLKNQLAMLEALVVLVGLQAELEAAMQKTREMLDELQAQKHLRGK